MGVHSAADSVESTPMGKAEVGWYLQRRPKRSSELVTRRALTSLAMNRVVLS